MHSIQCHHREGPISGHLLPDLLCDNTSKRALGCPKRTGRTVQEKVASQTCLSQAQRPREPRLGRDTEFGSHCITGEHRHGMRPQWPLLLRGSCADPSGRPDGPNTPLVQHEGVPRKARVGSAPCLASTAGLPAMQCRLLPWTKSDQWPVRLPGNAPRACLSPACRRKRPGGQPVACRSASCAQPLPLTVRATWGSAFLLLPQMAPMAGCVAAPAVLVVLLPRLDPLRPEAAAGPSACSSPNPGLLTFCWHNQSQSGQWGSDWQAFQAVF